MEENKKFNISTSAAIVVAGIFIMIGILLTKQGGVSDAPKTLSEQVGVSKSDLEECLQGADLKSLWEESNSGAEKAMSGVPEEERGTPYSVVIGSNGVKTEIRGAYPKEAVQGIIQEVLSGSVTNEYKGEVEGYREGDHIIGNPDAPVLVIEYADLECPYCQKFEETMKEVIAESNGEVAWIYRHWIIHVGTGQNALPKAAAAECVADLKGNDAFWQYINLVFGLMNTTPTSDIDKL